MRPRSSRPGRMAVATSPRIHGDRRDPGCYVPTTHSWRSRAAMISRVCEPAAIAVCLVAGQRPAVHQASVSPVRAPRREPISDRSQNGRDKDLRVHGVRRTCRSPTGTHATDLDPVDNMWTDRRCNGHDGVQSQNLSTDSHRDAAHPFPNTRPVAPSAFRQIYEPAEACTIPVRCVLVLGGDLSPARIQS